MKLANARLRMLYSAQFPAGRCNGTMSAARHFV